jgi:hypothetical protein
MTIVLATPPFIAFFDDNGNPLSGGKIYTYAAGTTTPKAAYTDATGTVAISNPIVLDSAGRSVWFIDGSYKYIITDAAGTTIRTIDNVTSFSTIASASSPFFQTFSGTGAQTAFTLSTDLGSDSKNLMVFVDSVLQANVSNGTFTTDTIWTKGAGWTIGAGVATAAGAISTAISQPAIVTLVAGQAYAVTYTITRSAGGLIPSIGGQNGTERTASGTYREVIIAGSTQTIAWTGNAFTGTLDDVSVSVASSAGQNIVSPSNYTLSGTTLTFSTAPAIGSSNIFVFSPSSLVGTASASAAAAAGSAVSASASAVTAVAASDALQRWTYSTTTAMADPSTGNIRFNNASPASATAMAISASSSNTGNPNYLNQILTWDDSTSTIHGVLSFVKYGAAQNFLTFSVTGTLTNNTTWVQLTIANIASGGSISNTDVLVVDFARTGDVGSGSFTSADITGQSPATIAVGDSIVVSSLANSGALRKGTVQGVLDVIPVRTVAQGGTGLGTLTANNVILGNGTSNPSFVAPSTSGNVLTSNGTTWQSTAPSSSVAAATQAEMEAASSTTVYVSPGRGQYHPGMAKAWLMYNGVTNTILASYNISSVTDNGTGDFTINFTTAFSSADYAMAQMCNAPTATDYAVQIDTANVPTASACRVNVINSGSGAKTDIIRISAVFFGDQ